MDDRVEDRGVVFELVVVEWLSEGVDLFPQGPQGKRVCCYSKISVKLEIKIKRMSRALIDY